MKTVIALLIVALSATCLYAKPIVAQMTSMIEGQIVFEVPLNSQVKKGQLVEEVDPRQYQANVLDDQAAVNFYKDVYNADSKLVKENSVSLVSYLKSKYNLENYIEHEKRDEAIESHCYIYAPFNGKVTKIITYAGSGIGDGNLIMEITKDKLINNISSNS
ncbi:MAG: hypothetical protein GY756_21845 [bacterium]|nr:hypothetical protein [bacterium]